MSKLTRWNGSDKPSEAVFFTVHYADGTNVEVKDGVLFSVNDNDTMDIHIGVSRAWQLFGVRLCLEDCIKKLGLWELYQRYMTNMEKEAQA